MVKEAQGKSIIQEGKSRKKGEDRLLQPWAKWAVPAAPAVVPIYPLLPSPATPIQLQFPTWGSGSGPTSSRSLQGSIRKSLRHRDLVWCHHPRPNKALSLGQESLLRQGSFPYTVIEGT